MLPLCLSPSTLTLTHSRPAALASWLCVEHAKHILPVTRCFSFFLGSYCHLTFFSRVCLRLPH